MILKRTFISGVLSILISILGFVTLAVPKVYADTTSNGGDKSISCPGSDVKVAKASDCDLHSVAGDASACPGGGDFLGFPKWYKYLPSQNYVDQTTGQPTCIPQIDGLNSIWRIVAAVIELLIRLAALIAVGFVVFGGVTYTLSQGNPEKTKQALKTIISALVGLVIAIIATALVSFVAGRFPSK